MHGASIGDTSQDQEAAGGTRMGGEETERERRSGGDGAQKERHQ